MTRHKFRVFTSPFLWLDIWMVCIALEESQYINEHLRVKIKKIQGKNYISMQTRPRDSSKKEKRK